MTLIREFLDAPAWLRCVLLVVVAFVAIFIAREQTVRRADREIDAMNKIHDQEVAFLERQLAACRDSTQSPLDR